MPSQHPRMVELGWTGYLNSTRTLVYETVLGRHPVKVQYPLQDALHAMERVLINTSYENPCDFIGSYASRVIAGKDMWSEHAYGVAIDFDYGGDTDGDGDPTIDKNPHLHRPIVPGDPGFGVEWQILEHQVRAIEAIKNTHGESIWFWLGWPIGDSMHFAVNVRPDRCLVDWDSVGGDMSFATWVAGWVSGLAEDKTGTRARFERLFSGNQTEVNYWMTKLDNPNDPEWPGFYARRELEFWAQSSEGA